MGSDKCQICPNCFADEYINGRCRACDFTKNQDVRSILALPGGLTLCQRYLVGRVLGEGGFGITYKILDTRNGQVLAMKEYLPSGIAARREGSLCLCPGSPSDAKAFEKGLKRFLREAEILKQLGGMTSVVQIMDSFMEYDTAYFTMEYLEGSTLGHVIRAAGGRLSVREITQIISQSGMTLDVVHKKTGILHRDISPENIYILRDGSVKLIDFGSAKQIARGQNQRFSVVLKKGFAPYEQYSQELPQGPYTDVYALAGTYYYALTGVMVPSAMDRISGGRYIPLKDMNAGVSREASDAVDDALMIDYKRRIQTAEEFVRRINAPKAAPVPAPRSQTGAQSRKIGPAAAGSLPPRPVPASAARAYVKVLSGSQAGNRWELPGGMKIKLGRSVEDCNIVLRGHQEISKVHCILCYDAEHKSFLARDCSSNGTYVLLPGNQSRQAARMAKGKVYKLVPGAIMALASNACKIKLELEG